MDCLHPDRAAATAYGHGCRCTRCRTFKSEQTARRRARNGAAYRLTSRTAVIGHNAVEPGPLVAFCATRGVTAHCKPELRDTLVVRFGPKAALIPHKLRRAVERGWIGEKAVDEICVTLGTLPAIVYGAAWDHIVCQDATPAELAEAGIEVPA